MKAATAIGIGVAFWRPAAQRHDGRNESRLVHEHRGADDHPRRHRRGDAGERGDAVDEAHPGPLQARLLRRTARHARAPGPAGVARRPGPPRGPAGARRAARRGPGHASPATPCSSWSTAPTRRWCTRSWRPRSTAWPPATRPAAAPFEKAGGFAPTMGIIGTVLGLVHVLQNLAAPSTLGPSISAAFLATLMGVGSANVIFLPIANRLKAISAEEVELRMMTLEGILSIQAGDNPRLVADKLMSYLPPAEREAEDEPRTARGRRPRAYRPRRPSDGARTRPQTPRARRRARQRRALAADLRRHDHAADGAVHGAVLDLLGEHLQVPNPPAGAARRPSPGTSCRAASRSPSPARAPTPAAPPPRRHAGDRAADPPGHQ